MSSDCMQLAHSVAARSASRVGIMLRLFVHGTLSQLPQLCLFPGTTPWHDAVVGSRKWTRHTVMSAPRAMR